MLGITLSILIAFISMFVPGVLLAFALLHKTELHTFEITVIGFIFGLIAPATLTWLESYLMYYIHAFSFSLALFEANALLLTLAGLYLCKRQGALDDFKLFLKEKKYLIKVPKFSLDHHGSAHKQNSAFWVWAILLALMLIAFSTRIFNISTAPKFFEFDPYFDMIDTHYILTYGKQLLLDPAAWPVVSAGTNHRIQPIVPYLEAYWYSLSNALHFHAATFSTSLMSYVGGVYPPITAALLVFAIFMLLYHEYDARIGLIGASFTTMMPVLFSTFIAGEQLLEPWGIFSLFFFIAAYMLAIRDMKNTKLSIFAGVAFASTFLGAHYYTVTAGIMVLYIFLEGMMEFLRGENLRNFYKMNAAILATVIVLYALYMPYGATLESNISSIFGVPIIVSGPVLALVFVAAMDFIYRFLVKGKILIRESNFTSRLAFILSLLAVAAVVIMFTRVGNPIKSYIELSTRFTTPSKALFMTVQEFIPTGPAYKFGAQGFGAIGASIFNTPVFIWLVCAAATSLIFVAVAFRHSKTGILYIATVLPLMAAGFSEVKYLPHFGTAYILLFGITLGELYYLVSSNYYKREGESKREAVMLTAVALGVLALLGSFSLYSFGVTSTIAIMVLFLALLVALIYLTQHERGTFEISSIYHEHKLATAAIAIVALYFMFGMLFAVLAAAYIISTKYILEKKHTKNDAYLVALCVLLALASFSAQSLALGEASSVYNTFSAAFTYWKNPLTACSTISNNGNALGYNLFCNAIPDYWLNAMSWLRSNVGPNAPRVLAWWDYGDWINWFGNSNAVLRGDNSVAAEDYATAANYAMGEGLNYTPAALANFMNTNQTKYVLFDRDLVAKWQALNFLGCVHVNGTSKEYASAQGSLQNPPVPYVLGNSQCEINHDPQFALVPLSTLIQSNATNTQQNINNYCAISNGTKAYIRAYLVQGNSLSNNTVCVDGVPNSNGVLSVFNSNGTKLNAAIQSSYYLGVVNVGGAAYVEYLMIYLPNSPNGSITNAPSEFYSSNYYKGFFLGELPGFTLVYPANSTGVNLINGTYPVRIYALNNFTGTLPAIPEKPSWITNNDIMP